MHSITKLTNSNKPPRNIHPSMTPCIHNRVNKGHNSIGGINTILGCFYRIGWSSGLWSKISSWKAAFVLNYKEKKLGTKMIKLDSLWVRWMFELCHPEKTSYRHDSWVWEGEFPVRSSWRHPSLKSINCWHHQRTNSRCIASQSTISAHIIAN